MSRIGGSIHLAVFPRFGVALHDVVVANAAGSRDPQMITVGKMIIGAELMPLLSGHLQVTKIILKQPVIHLEVNGKGAGNWQFAIAGPGNTSDGVSLQVERIRIENGEVTYFDAHTGKAKTLSNVAVLLTTPVSNTGARELSLEGTATYNAVAMTYGAKLDDIRAFLNGQRSGAGLSFSSNLFQIGFSGQMDTPGSMTREFENRRQVAAPARRVGGPAAAPRQWLWRRVDRGRHLGEGRRLFADQRQDRARRDEPGRRPRCRHERQGPRAQGHADNRPRQRHPLSRAGDVTGPRGGGRQPLPTRHLRSAG